MICSYLSNQILGIIYVHAEQSYTFISESASNPFLFEGNSDRNNEDIAILSPAIYASRLTISTVSKILTFVQELKVVPRYFVLDFEKITSLQKNISKSLEDLQDLLTSKESGLILYNLNVNESEIQEKKAKFYTLTSRSAPKILEGLKFIDFKKSIIDLKEKTFQSRFSNCFVEQNPLFLHESSSVYLNQYFDFKKFILIDSYIYYCIYNLALKMIEKNQNHLWEISPSSKTILFCQTLSGAFIGSILSDLLGLDLFIIDHLGPINKLYNSVLFKKIDASANYIVVSDVLCLGTEVKNAKSIIEFSGAKYIGNVSFVRIESRKEKDVDFKDIEYLFRINEKYNPVKYSISTALALNKKPIKRSKKK